MRTRHLPCEDKTQLTDAEQSCHSPLPLTAASHRCLSPLPLTAATHQLTTPSLPHSFTPTFPSCHSLAATPLPPLDSLAATCPLPQVEVDGGSAAESAKWHHQAREPTLLLSSSPPLPALLQPSHPSSSCPPSPTSTYPTSHLSSSCPNPHVSSPHPTPHRQALSFTTPMAHCSSCSIHLAQALPRRRRRPLC